MKARELKIIADRFEVLEREEKKYAYLDHINGAFVHIEMYDFDDDKLYVNLKVGVQTDAEDTRSSWPQKAIIDRHTLEWTKDYPFSEGDDYWVIENDKVVWSCWDWQSEELFDLNPNQMYFTSKKKADEYLQEYNLNPHTND